MAVWECQHCRGERRVKHGDKYYCADCKRPTAGSKDNDDKGNEMNQGIIVVDIPVMRDSD